MTNQSVDNQAPESVAEDITLLAPVTNEEPVAFTSKAMVLNATSIVQSIIVAPETFTMPGYSLVEVSSSVNCAPGMKYNSEAGTFEDVPEVPPHVELPQEEPVDIGAALVGQGSDM